MIYIYMCMYVCVCLYASYANHTFQLLFEGSAKMFFLYHVQICYVSCSFFKVLL